MRREDLIMVFRVIGLEFAKPFLVMGFGAVLIARHAGYLTRNKLVELRK